MTTNILVGFRGNNGTDLPLSLLDAYQEADQKGPFRGFPRLSPQTQGYINFEAIVVQPQNEETETDAVLREYKKFGKFGPFGDVIKVLKTDEALYITEIAQKAFPKPALATDMMLLLQGHAERKKVIYLVAIERKNEPGKGKPATIGGFNNVAKKSGVDILESAIATAIGEGKEEGGCQITLDNPEALREDYNCKQAKGQISLGKEGQVIPCFISDAGTFKTSDAPMKEGGELIEGLDGQKRVHLATAITVTAEVPESIELTQAVVQGWFEAGDDAAKLLVYNVTGEVKAAGTTESAQSQAAAFFQKHEMGIQHHVKILEAGFSKAHEIFYKPL